MKYRPSERMVLLDCLRTLYPDSPKVRLKKMLDRGRVWVDGKQVKIPNRMVEGGSLLEIREQQFAVERLRDLRIVHEDAHLIVTEKKPQFLSVGTDKEKHKTAYHQLLQHLRQRDAAAELYIVHRLDYGTSGLLMFAKSREAQELLKEMFATRRIERHYRAVIQGHMRPEEGTLEDHLAESQTLRVYVTRDKKKGKHAVTHYKTLQKGKTCSLLDIRLGTGRRGQIRVQLAHRGHPIAGDHEHGSELKPLDRLCLHACKLEFEHPISRKSVVVESKMPDAFYGILDASGGVVSERAAKTGSAMRRPHQTQKSMIGSKRKQARINRLGSRGKFTPYSPKRQG